MKVMHIQTLKETEGNDFIESRLNHLDMDEGIDRPRLKEGSSFRKQIRQQI